MTDHVGSSVGVRSPSVFERLAADPAQLAGLRRGLGKAPGTVPEMWPVVVPLTEGRGFAYEAAVHHALSLFAVHQQSQVHLVHRSDGPGVGALARALRLDQKIGEGATRRFLAAATADSVGEVAHHLRGLLTLARSAGVLLDYERLIWDLTMWAAPARRPRVRRAWGRDFYSAPAGAEEDDDEAPSADASVLDDQGEEKA